MKIVDANGNQLGNATYDIMLFKGYIRLDETHRAGEKAANQLYTFPEPGVIF